MQTTTEFSTLPLPFTFGLVENEVAEQDIPRIYKWTKDEYYRKSPHATAVSLTDEAFRQLSLAGFSIRSQLPIDFGADELVPDIAIVRGKIRDYKEFHPKTVELILEVADTTLRHDRNKKLKLYAVHNVPEYWIVNINNRCLEVYRRPSENGYKEATIFNEDESAAPLFKPDAQIAVSDLLP